MDAICLILISFLACSMGPVFTEIFEKILHILIYKERKCDRTVIGSFSSLMMVTLGKLQKYEKMCSLLTLHPELDGSSALFLSETAAIDDRLVRGTRYGRDLYYGRT